MTKIIARFVKDARYLEKVENNVTGKIEYVLMGTKKLTYNGPTRTLIELVNASGVEYVDNLYLISIDCHYLFAAFANNLQDALEEVGKYCRDQGYAGLLVDACNEDDEFFDESYTPINGGEYYLQMPTHAEELKIKGGNVK